MAFFSTEQLIGNVDLQTVFNPSTASPAVNKHAVGTILRGTDPVLGQGEFIYLPGVASTAVGAVVTYDLNAGTTTLAVAGTRGPVAVAMTANTSTTTYAFYQISGLANVSTTGVAAGNNLAVTATAGQLTVSGAASQKVDGAIAKTATSAGFSLVELARPSANGNT